MSAALNDFSLYIFHPYGGGQQKPSFTIQEGLKTNSFLSNFFLHLCKIYIHYIEENGDQTRRKDALSLNVQHIRLNISRFHRPSSSELVASSVKFSAVCDVGDAKFIYDMHRLGEILALPKAWYRASLARRMFFGEEQSLAEESLDESDLSDVSQQTCMYLYT